MHIICGISIEWGWIWSCPIDVQIFINIHCYFKSLKKSAYPTVSIKVKKQETIRNRYNQVPHLTRYTIWESDKTYGHITPKRSAFSRQVTRSLQGIDNDSIIKTNVKH